MATNLEMNAPNDWGRRCSRYRVGPKSATPTTSRTDRMEFSSETIFMPRLMPKYTDAAATAPITMITATLTPSVPSSPKTDPSPAVNCRDAKPKDVEIPRTVAIMARNSMTIPAGRRLLMPKRSSHAPLKVAACLRLWTE